MFEARVFQTPAISQPLVPDSAPDVIPFEIPLEVNDNEIITPPRDGEQRTFELPASVWKSMLACYAIFLAALLGATGGGHAILAIVVSAIYIVMFFGTARVMLSQAPAQPRCALEKRDGVLPTLYGPMGRREVFGQILVVPIAVAFFGIAIAIISAVTR